MNKKTAKNLTLAGLGPLDPNDPNPMIAKFGRSRGHSCRLCRHLLAVGGYTRRYYKCELRGVTHGIATDHRQHWNACGRWQPI